MHGSPELLEFYLVEATEYLDSLDQLVSGTGGAPDGNAFIATARALRGASSMAKVDPIAQIAGAIEQVAHGVRDGELRWTLDLHAALRQTVDDLRALVRGVRVWGERETARAEARLTDLQRFLPGDAPRQAAPGAAATAPVFIALQSSAIAAELDAFVANPQHRRALDDALTRARTMRGIAGIADFPPLADVADAVDRTARALMPDAPLAEHDVELFRAASAVLRQTSARLREGEPLAGESPEIARFARAVRALEAASGAPASAAPAGPQAGGPAAPVGDGQVVPIDTLYFSDTGPHILQRAAAPPTTHLQRFRDEILTRAEHIRRLVNDARQAHDLAARERSARALGEALRDMHGVAASFDVHQVAAFFGEAARSNDLHAPALLDALDAGALLLLTPGESTEELERRLAVLHRTRQVTPVFTPAVMAPAEAETRPPVAPPPTPPPLAIAPTPPFSSPVRPASAAPAPPPAAHAEVPVAAAPPPVAPPVIAPDPAEPSAPSPFPPRTTGVRKVAATPTGRELQSLLQEGIAGFRSLDDEPLSAPARLDEDDIVPIESLVYRGPSAIRRAIEVRDAMRASGRTDEATLQEIFDLLDLAQAE